MDKNQAIEILETIHEIYPRFELTDRKIEVLIPQLKKMDYDRVMSRLNDHIVSNPFPPSIAEIAAYAPEKNEHLEKVEKWKREAAQVPESKKREFYDAVKKLIEDKSR